MQVSPDLFSTDQTSRSWYRSNWRSVEGSGISPWKFSVWITPLSGSPAVGRNVASGRDTWSHVAAKTRIATTTIDPTRKSVRRPVRSLEAVGIVGFAWDTAAPPATLSRGQGPSASHPPHGCRRIQWGCRASRHRHERLRARLTSPSPQGRLRCRMSGRTPVRAGRSVRVRRPTLARVSWWGSSLMRRVIHPRLQRTPGPPGLESEGSSLKIAC